MHSEISNKIYNYKKNIKNVDENSTILDGAQRIIREEAQSINKLSEFLDENFPMVVKKILETKGRLIITGIGKSALIATKIVQQ